MADVKTKPRFDVESLRDLAGQKVFARGAAYHEDGLVDILAIEPARVLAQVAGTEDYRTELTGRGKKIGGDCSCPAFEDWGFCKHMVAVALAANEAGGDTPDSVGALSRIRDHLKQKSVDALAEMIVSLAERDTVLFRKLEIAATAAIADDKTLEARLRKAIDSATRVRGFVEYREAGNWAEGVTIALDLVAEHESGPRAALALTLAEHAIDRIEEAAGSMDDSDGHCGAVLQRACDIHLAAAQAARPDPVPFARNLFAREMDGGYDSFYGAAAVYADVLGEQGLAEYRRLATNAWDKLPRPSRKTRTRDEFDSARTCLKRILDFFAERDGDVPARIALRTADLSSAWNYLELAQFCLDQRLKDDALRWAEEGLWMFEDDRPDERLVFFAADILAGAGRKGDAEKHLWQAFEKAPSLELYARLRKLGKTAARDRAVKILEDRLVAKTRTPWSGGASVLIAILMREKRFDAAWAAVATHGASIDVRQDLASQSEATHPRHALEVYAECVEQFAVVGGNPAYEKAAQLVAHMAKLRSRDEQTAYVLALKVRFERRRNFIKLLK